ncbi:MAG: glycyl-radical enzyme activating protein [Clostridia bacterium]|nr:glycyl-radical enzyme activating protein [Clostridia bacterium]
MLGRITNIQRFSTHDGPGIRTTVFLKGCPMRCIWCHNPETWHTAPQIQLNATRCTGCGGCEAVCPAGCHRIDVDETAFRHLYDSTGCVRCGKCIAACRALALEWCGKEMEAEEVISIVERDRAFYGKTGGLTVSGGEPMMQPAFTNALLGLAKERGLSTCVEICGVGAENLDDGLCDRIYFDIKTPDPALHRRLTGRDNADILANLRRLAERCSDKIVVRMVIAAGLNDSPELVEQLTALTSSLGIAHVELNPFHPYGSSKASAVGMKSTSPGKEAVPDDRALAKLRAHAEA